MAARWYAICSKPHKEDVLWRQLQAYGFEVFYPRFLLRPVHPGSIKKRPYFPGYLFVKTDLDAVGVSTFQWMPFTTGMVCFGGKPAYVPETLIEAIQTRIQGFDFSVESAADKQPVPDDGSRRPNTYPVYKTLFDPAIPGRERVRALLKILDVTNGLFDQDDPHE